MQICYMHAFIFGPYMSDIVRDTCATKCFVFIWYDDSATLRKLLTSKVNNRYFPHYFYHDKEKIADTLSSWVTIIFQNFQLGANPI